MPTDAPGYTGGSVLSCAVRQWQIPFVNVEAVYRYSTGRSSKCQTSVDLDFIDFQQFIYDPAFWKKRLFIFFDFAARTDSTEVVLNDEAQEYIWIDPQEALELSLDSYTFVSVEKYVAAHTASS